MSDKTRCTLICDTRERAMLRHESELVNTTILVKQIAIGDYVVITPAGKILAVIERKSLEDYAASIKDGRSNNKVKMLKLRKETGCSVIYLIEGPEFPEPQKCYGNIPYRYIESSIMHLIVRDGICVLRAKDTLETARLLARFVTSMDTLCAKIGSGDGLTGDISNNNATADNTAGDTDNTAGDTTGAGAIPNYTATLTPAPILAPTPAPILAPTPAPNCDTMPIIDMTDILSHLTQLQPKSDDDVIREMWACFRGISTESASEYMKYYSLADIVCGRISAVQLAGFKLSSGRKIGKKALNSLTSTSPAIKLLGTIPGISIASATTILATRSLKQLVTDSIGNIESIVATKTKRKVGRVLADKILKYFNYKA